MAQAQNVAAVAAGMKSDKRQAPITPPGSISQEHFQAHCTSCHLCVSKCPSHVLKPAFMEYGLGGMMQPTVFFERVSVILIVPYVGMFVRMELSCH